MKKTMTTILTAAVSAFVCAITLSLAASADTYADACKAYYDFLKNEVDSIGAPIADLADSASENYPFVPDTGWINQQVLFARLIDFDNNGIPELYFGKDISGGDMANASRYNLYTYAWGQVVPLVHNIWPSPDYEIHPDGISSGLLYSQRITKDASGKSYFVFEEGSRGTTAHSASFYTLDPYGNWIEAEKMHIHFSPDIYISQDVMTSTGKHYYYLGASSGYGTSGGREVSQDEYFARLNSFTAGGDEVISLNPDSVTETMNYLAGYLPSNYVYPSDWAAQAVTDGITRGVVPRNLQKKYCEPITRAEFCTLATAYYENATHTSITKFMDFNDTNDDAVRKMGALGVVNGVGGGNFAPNNPLTREEAAVILTNLAAALGNPLPESAPAFADHANISDWALAQTGKVQAAGIMGGVGDSLFAPKESYTREQSIVTIMRMDNILVPAERIEMPAEAEVLMRGTLTPPETKIFPENTTNTRLIWTSSDQSIFSVNRDNGTITGKKLGTATLTATAEVGGASASCQVTVVSPFAVKLPVTVPFLQTHYFSSTGIGIRTIDDIPKNPIAAGELTVTEVKESETKPGELYITATLSDYVDGAKDNPDKFNLYLKWAVKNKDGEIIDSGVCTRIKASEIERGESFTFHPIRIENFVDGEPYTLEFIADDGKTADDIADNEPKIDLPRLPFTTTYKDSELTVEDIDITFTYNESKDEYLADITISGTVDPQDKGYNLLRFGFELVDSDNKQVKKTDFMYPDKDEVDEDGNFVIEPGTYTKRIRLKGGERYKIRLTNPNN